MRTMFRKRLEQLEKSILELVCLKLENCEEPPGLTGSEPAGWYEGNKQAIEIVQSMMKNLPSGE